MEDWSCAGEKLGVLVAFSSDPVVAYLLSVTQRILLIGAKISCEFIQFPAEVMLHMC